MPEELQIQFNNFTIGRNKNGNLVSKWAKDWASLVAQLVKNLPAVRETQVRSLGWEDPLEKEMATHSSILAWRIPWTEEYGGYSSWGQKESDMNE